MKVIIAGSRNYSRLLFAQQIEEYRNKFPITEIVSGMALGVDTGAALWAKANGYKVTEFPVSDEDWKVFGLWAGPRRNQQMAKYADALIAFWDGISAGTKNMISEMRKLKKPYIIVKPK